MTEGRSSPGFFLGANSARGFVSLYDGFLTPGDECFLWVLKGGPGCGKSSFMRRIGQQAEKAGFETEYILCSGDPDSLDGIRIPGLRIAYTDGTAPHVQEPALPGAAGAYLDLGQFLRQDGLRPKVTELAFLTGAYKEKYAEAYALLSAAAPLLPKHAAGILTPAAEAKLRQRAAALAAREFPKAGSGTRALRYLSAFSCRGRVRLEDTVCALCDRLWIADNICGAGHDFLSVMEALAAQRGIDRILCPDPLEPEKTEALLLPGLRIGFLADDGGWDPGALPVYRHLRLDAAAELSPERRALLRQRRRESGMLLDAAEQALREAKALHDALEAVYRPCVDFRGIDALAQRHLDALGLA